MIMSRPIHGIFFKYYRYLDAHSPIASCNIPPRAPARAINFEKEYNILVQYNRDEEEHDLLFSPIPKVPHDIENVPTQDSSSEDDFADDLNEEEDIFHSDAMITYNSPDFDINIQEFDPYTFIKHLPPYDDVIRSGNLSTVLPPRSSSLTTTHTLVLDLDETLVHCSIDALPNPDLQFLVEFSGQTFNVYVKIRPFLKHFMEQVSRLYEIVIFTASQRVYADKLLDTLDPTHTQIQFRLFRDSCICVNGNYMKDLNVLGRDVNKCIIVDNSPHAFGYQVDNGIPINSWFDDENDNELLKLLPFLIRLSKSDQVQSEIRNRYHLHKFVENSP